MITDPTALLVFFAGFVALLFWIAGRPSLARLFRVIPIVAWIYLLPVFATTCGLTPAESPFYTWCSQNLLPFSLMLLIMTTDLKSIARLGPIATAMMLSGTLGIVLGGPIALAIFQPFLDPQAWKGLAALAGSWIGGGSNMIAIKEGVNCPSSAFSPVVIVDSVVGYGWMSIMIAFSGYQNAIDRWNGARREVIDDLNRRLEKYQRANRRPITLPSFTKMLGIGFVGSWLCMRAGEPIGQIVSQSVPQLSSVFSAYTFGILLVVVVGLLLSFTPARDLEHEGASTIAYGGLYLLMATLGAGGDLRTVVEAPLLVVVGMVWLSVHVICLVVAMRILRAPVFLMATGSMGNVGGVISTPVVAGAFQTALPAVGVLMGVLGNLVGTPAGLLAAQLLSWVAQAYCGEAAL